jgi:DNA-binding SARP family transcriptional activator
MAQLRQALWLLGKSFEATGAPSAGLLSSDRDVIGLRPEASVDVDAALFEMLLDSDPPRHEDAVMLYHGELAENLPGLECLAAYREELSDRYEDSLAAVARSRLEGEDFEGARSAALNLVGRDPFREDAHRVVMEAYARAGTRDQVVRHFRRLQSLLFRELGISPLPETEVTYAIAMATARVRSAECVESRASGRADASSPVRLSARRAR